MINPQQPQRYPTIHPRRKAEMLDTRKMILKEYAFFKRIYLQPYQHIVRFSLLEYKLKEGLPLRGYFSRKVYQYVVSYHSHQDDPASELIFFRKLPFLLEVVMTIQYYHNQILDGKAGVTGRAAISKNLLLANILKEELYCYIRETFGTHSQTVEHYIRQIFRLVDFGQLMEATYNRYTNYLQDKLPKILLSSEHTIPEAVQNTLLNLINHSSEKRSFLKVYLQRIYLTSAILFKLAAELICKILNGNNPDTDFTNFITYYGVMLQIVNDNCDFVPSKYEEKTVGKRAFDSFSDLKNKNVTLPIFLHLNERKKGPIRQFLQMGKLRTTNWEACLFNEMIRSKIIFKAIDIGKEIGALAKSYLDKENPHAWAFDDMVDISVFNRFYFHYNTNEYVKRIYLKNISDL